MGGASRGSMCSITRTLSGIDEIKGIYMLGALPKQEVWPTALVTLDSPPIQFAYGPCCPKPIITTGADKCVVFKEDDPST